MSVVGALAWYQGPWATAIENQQSLVWTDAASWSSLLPVIPWIEITRSGFSVKPCFVSLGSARCEAGVNGGGGPVRAPCEATTCDPKKVAAMTTPASPTSRRTPATLEDAADRVKPAR